MPHGGRTEITMEKKTIGKFIAALRKASGMTQRELGEKLFVSDKTISRWECDECTPELSLIPTIAEIFGITTDELLRGERNNPERIAAETEEGTARQKAKSEKQFRLMLDRADRKYKNCTLIAVGISILGLIAAMIANLGFNRGWVAFFLAAAFCVASEICQICFAINARVLIDEDDDTHAEQTQNANIRIVKTAIGISLLNILILAFCLPLIVFVGYSNWGLTFEAWFSYGGVICLPIALVISYVLYHAFVRKALCNRGLLVLSEQEKGALAEKSKLIQRTVCVGISAAVLLFSALIFWTEVGTDLYWQYTRKEYIFDNAADFKAFMENEYDEWYREGYSHIDENGNEVIHEPIGGYYPMKSYQNVYGDNGEVLFRYYHNGSLYYSIDFTDSSPDKMPVTVIPSQSRSNGDVDNIVINGLIALIVATVIVTPTVYAVMLCKIKKKYEKK